jgi:chemosensory pili system protein ChpA (sensor histidine kinase/response regulator)
MLDPEILQSFIEEAESYLPTIRGGILLNLQNGGKAHGEMQTSLRHIHTIKGAALMVGLEELGKVAAELENEIEIIIEEKRILSDEDSRRLLDRVSQIDAILLKTHLDTEDFSFDFNAFIEESFENLQINNPPKQTDVLSTDSFGEIEPEENSFVDFQKEEGSFENFGEDFSEEEFEIDEEMLEVFALEAEDLLRNIAANLEILEKQPANGEALLEIRRNAHTFKGSAGIVGLKTPSEMAHRVEDLLDYLAENEIAGNEKIFQILLASTDCLSTLTNGEDSPQLAKKIARVYKDFDEIMISLAAKDAETSAPQISNPKEENKSDAAAVTGFEIVQTADSAQKSQIQNPKAIVRVSLERLDDLVKIVRGLVISRSVFEQRLGELDRQIEEFHLTTRRMQRSTAKLETDFEADMLNVQAPKSKNQWLSAETAQTANANPHSFDTLELDRYTEFHQTTRELVETTSDAFAINSALDNLRGNLETLFDSQHRLIEEMQDKLLRIRMVSFGTLSPRLTRTVRVTCEEENKQAELLIEGENLEIDTQILDSLIEPLLHLLRNAVAHGIESPETRRLLGKPEYGKINLRVANEGMHVILTITDDGRGISVPSLKEKAVQNNLISAAKADSMSDEEALQLIFLPGLTTAEKLSQTAGRGVGMNIIKIAVERQQGTISIASEPQKGSTFTLRLPMALAVTRALLVKSGEQTFAFPLGIVKQISEISGETLKKARSDKKLQFGAVKYTLLHLNDILGFSSTASPNEETARVLLLENVENPCALLVDRIIKPEEIVIKPLGAPLQNMNELLGAAILGDGSIVPVLDLFYLLNHKKPKLKTTKPEIEKSEAKPEVKVLIVDDSPSVRHLTSKIVKNAGFQAIVAKDGLEALEILQTLQDFPEVILTDVEMPRMDGYELLSSLKRNAALQKIPVVMITSRAGEKHRQKALDLGVSEYLTKPFDDAKLIEVINKLTSFKE